MKPGDAVEVYEARFAHQGDPSLHATGTRGTVVEVVGDQALVDLGEGVRGWYAREHLSITQ